MVPQFSHPLLQVNTQLGTLPAIVLLLHVIQIKGNTLIIFLLIYHGILFKLMNAIATKSICTIWKQLPLKNKQTNKQTTKQKKKNKSKEKKRKTKQNKAKTKNKKTKTKNYENGIKILKHSAL